MAGGDDERMPASSPYSSRCREAWVPRGPGRARSSECQKEGPRSRQQMVAPPKSADSPPQMVTQVQPPKSVDSWPQMVTPVHPPESLDLALQLGALFQRPKSVGSRSTSCGSGAVVSDSGAAPFDICRDGRKCSFGPLPSLLEMNREKRCARDISKSTAALQHLRPGMVLLRKFLKPDDQEDFINLATDMVLSLGKNWDPDSSKYGDIRPFDGAQPPKIPEELTKLVKDATEASRKFLKLKGQGASKSLKEIPLILPDICIVNFYTSPRRLGLHQDKDETTDSLDKKLPVISFSLGDTAEFLYGDTRDETKASKVKLESGDVLIFGGPSRHIFHGISNITQNTAPTYVTNEANLRPGRLNLIFRQY